MSEDLPPEEIEQPQPDGLYDVAGIGRVLRHEEGQYVVRLPDGRVCGFPAQAGEPTSEAAAADVAAWLDGSHVAKNPPPPPEPTLDDRKAALKVRAAHRRWEREVGGIVIDGVTIRTDRESQAMLSGAVTFADLADSGVFNWKTASGEWQQLSETALRSLAFAVGEHVQACFDRERDLCEQIDAAETEELMGQLTTAVESFRV